jgi:metal-sulfur cluster biosynthetic enzyme
MTMAMPDESAVRDALRQVQDPEAGMNIVDLGLVYGIVVSDASAHIELTLTSAACPMTEMIVDDVVDAVTAAVPKEVLVDVALVWDPPWAPDRMSDLAREHFGWSPR